MDDPAVALRPGSRLAGIEGLRAIAASAIVVLHAWTILAAANLIAQPYLVYFFAVPLHDGVTLFFVLSGFLLWRPFARAIASGRDLPSLRRYARNRALRILPAYWAVLAVSALVLQSVRLVPVSANPLVGALHDPALLLKDALLVQELSPRTLSSGIEPAWSLSVELTFYLLLPLLGLLGAALAARSATRRRRIAAALAPALLLVLVAIAGKLVATFVVPGPEGAFRDTWHSVIDRSFLTHADLFAAGMLVAVMRVEHEHARLRLPGWARAGTSCLCGFTVFFALLSYYELPHYIDEPLTAVLFAVVLSRVVTPVPGAPPSRFVRLLERRPLVAAGTISYSSFLWSFPATEFLVEHRLLLTHRALWEVPVDFAIVASVVTALAAVTYLAVERPVLSLRRRPGHAPVAAPTVLTVEPASLA